MICTAHQILFGSSNGEKFDGRWGGGGGVGEKFIQRFGWET